MSIKDVSKNNQLFTVDDETKQNGIKLLTKAFGDKKSAQEHARDFWAKEGESGVFYHATNEKNIFDFEKEKASNFDKGLRSGISNINGLYVGVDWNALHNFYNLAAERGESIIRYEGTPKILDMTNEKAMKDFVKKFNTGDKIEKEIERLGYDGIKYFDPYSTGE
jgi:hypothetical protein